MNTKSFLLLFPSLLIPFHLLLADFEDDIYSQEKIESPSESKSMRIVGSFDFVGKTDIDKRHYKDQTVQFYSIGGDAQTVLCYSKQDREAIFVAAGFSHQKIDWNQNPRGQARGGGNRRDRS